MACQKDSSSSCTVSLSTVENLLDDFSKKLEDRLDVIQNGIEALLSRDLACKDTRESRMHITSCKSDSAQQQEMTGMKSEKRQHDDSMTVCSMPSEITVRESDDAAASMFHLRETWMDMKRSKVHAAMEEQATTVSSLSMSVASPSVPQKSQWFIVRPNSYLRLGWDILGLVMIAYEMLTTPVHLAFGIEDSGNWIVLFWIVLTFWSVEIPMNFITGYYRDGSEELRFCQITQHYMRSWLIVDLVIVGVDWAGVFLRHFQDTGVSMARMGKTLKILKVFRSLRLLRLVKLKSILESLQDQIQSEHVHIAMSVVKFIIIILCVNHLVACGWYGMSWNISGQKNTWINVGGFSDVGFFYKYFTAFHWSLTQFTPASMDVVPHNLEERIYAVCVLMFALIVFSSFISSITTAMTQLRRLNSMFAKDVSLLRRYLRLRNIPMNLKIRVMRYVEHKLYLQMQEIQEKDVVLIKLLSRPLQMEVVHCTLSPSLTLHPFFPCYSDADPEAMKRVCFGACSCVNLSAGDILFTEASQEDRMFLVTRGNLYYTHTGSSKLISSSMSLNQHAVSENLESLNPPMDIDYFSLSYGDWCSEAALWTKWVHFGRMHATVESEILVVDASAFAKETIAHYKVGHGTVTYALGFVKRLNELAVRGIYSDYLPKALESDVLHRLASRSFASQQFPSERRVLKRLTSRLLRSSSGAFPGVNSNSAPTLFGAQAEITEAKSSEPMLDEIMPQQGSATTTST